MKINYGRRRCVELQNDAWKSDIEFMQGMGEIGRRSSDDEIIRIIP